MYIQTNHKLLVPIIAKPTGMASLRLQRLEFGEENVVTHIPGKELYLADTLSRAYLPISPDEAAYLENDRVVNGALCDC